MSHIGFYYNTSGISTLGKSLFTVGSLAALAGTVAFFALGGGSAIGFSMPLTLLGGAALTLGAYFWTRHERGTQAALDLLAPLISTILLTLASQLTFLCLPSSFAPFTSLGIGSLATCAAGFSLYTLYQTHHSGMTREEARKHYVHTPSSRDKIGQAFPDLQNKEEHYRNALEHGDEGMKLKILQEFPELDQLPLVRKATSTKRQRNNTRVRGG